MLVVGKKQQAPFSIQPFSPTQSNSVQLFKLSVQLFKCSVQPSPTCLVDTFATQAAASLETMDTCAVDTKKFKFQSMFQDRKEERMDQGLPSQPEPVEEIVQFPPNMISALRAKLEGTGILYINGPIGSGKRTLLKQAASIPVYDFWGDACGRSMEEKDLRVLRQKIQRPLGGENCIWMISPAGFLSDALINAMAKTSWQTRVVLIGDAKIQGLATNYIHYHQISPRFFQHVARTIGRTGDMDYCGNDLCMLQHGTHSASDKKPHVYFDTKAILNGDERPRNAGFYSKLWLEENILSSSSDLEACADFYKTLSESDTHTETPLSVPILALSLPKYTRAPNKLTPPTKLQIKSEHFQHRKSSLAYALHEAMSAQEEGIKHAHMEASPAKRARLDTDKPSAASSTDEPSAIPPEAVLSSGLQFCPNPEYEFSKTWLLHKSKLRTHVGGEETYSLIQSMVKPPPATLKQIHWIVAEYDGAIDLTVVAKALATVDDGILFDIVHVESRCAVLIYKPNFRNLDFTLGGLTPTLYVANLPSRAGQQKAKQAQLKLVSTFQNLPGDHAGNMYLHKAGTSEDDDVAMLLDFFKDMSNEQYNEFVLKANLKRENESTMTTVENYISNAKIEPRIREFRKLASGKSDMVIRLSDPNIQGLVKKPHAFHEKCKRWRVTIHDTSRLSIEIPRLGNATNVVSMETFFQYPELHQELSLIIPGERRKGKTEYAKFRALELAWMYVPDDPYFIFATTLDSMKSVQAFMKPGVPVVLDDVGGDDEKGQLIYSSVGIWKQILQLDNPAATRSRNYDTHWAPRQPKILTTNCKGLHGWLNKMFPRADLEHVDAIRMRFAEAEMVTESLWATTTIPKDERTHQPAVRPRNDFADMFDKLD